MKENCIIKKDKLVLKFLDFDEIEVVRTLRNYWSKSGYFIDSNMIQVHQQKAWYENYRHKEDDLMFVILYEGVFVGTIALYDINLKNYSCEFGRLMLMEEWTNKGIAFSVSKLLCNWAEEELGIKKFYLEVFSENIRAIRLYSKIGFKKCHEINGLIHMEFNVNSKK